MAMPRDSDIVVPEWYRKYRKSVTSKNVAGIGPCVRRISKDVRCTEKPVIRVMIARLLIKWRSVAPKSSDKNPAKIGRIAEKWEISNPERIRMPSI